MPNAFAIQRKMRQQIHNSVTENDKKMTKYNTNYDQTTKRPTNITKRNRDQEQTVTESVVSTEGQ